MPTSYSFRTAALAVAFATSTTTKLEADIISAELGFSLIAAQISRARFDPAEKKKSQYMYSFTTILLGRLTGLVGLGTLVLAHAFLQMNLENGCLRTHAHQVCRMTTDFRTHGWETARSAVGYLGGEEGRDEVAVEVVVVAAARPKLMLRIVII